jgi:hypothetical protein
MHSQSPSYEEVNGELYIPAAYSQALYPRYPYEALLVPEMMISFSVEAMMDSCKA